MSALTATQDAAAAADFLRRLSVADAKVLLDRTRCAFITRSVNHGF